MLSSPALKSAQPRVSVVMPVHNRPDYCAEAIESILSQTLTDFEFLIVDDGSTDGTAEVLDDYARRDARIRVFHQAHNQGVAASLNVGIAEARAGLIARMDSDDWALPRRLEKQVAFMDRNPRIGAAGSAMEIFDELQGKVVMRRRLPSGQRFLARALLVDCVFQHPTMILRTKLVQELNGYRRAFESAEDYDLWLRLNERAPMANMPDVLLRYRSHPNMVSSQRRIQQRYLTLVTRFLARRRRRGKGDPFEADKVYDFATMEAMLELEGDEKQEFWLEKFRPEAAGKRFGITTSHTNPMTPCDRDYISGLA